MKSITAIIAFTLTFGFSVALVGLVFGFPQTVGFNNSFCHIKDQSNIVSLLQRDIRNGQIRDSEINTLSTPSPADMSLAEYTEFVNSYVDKSQSMYDANLPRDFQTAWRQHMKAWRNYADFLTRINKTSVKITDRDFIQLEKEYNAEINRTWYKVLEIGDNHHSGLRTRLRQ